MHPITGATAVPLLPAHCYLHEQGEGEDEEVLPTNKAWHQIEAHPKAHLALEDQSQLHQLMLGGAWSLATSCSGFVSAGGGSSSGGSGQVKIPEHVSGSGCRGNADQEQAEVSA
jgi:hypothetical protein